MHAPNIDDTAFDAPDLMMRLESMDDEQLQNMGYGIVRMNKDGIVDLYNHEESKLAGLSANRVLGKHFFSEVAPCTNNYIVSGKYESGSDLDEIVPYVFTLRMRPTPVRLRLLKRVGGQVQFLLVERT